MNDATSKFVKLVTFKMNMLNKRVSILASTAREFTRGNIANNETFQEFLKQEEPEDILKYYDMWKGDLLVDYFNPRRKG